MDHAMRENHRNLFLGILLVLSNIFLTSATPDISDIVVTTANKNVHIVRPSYDEGTTDQEDSGPKAEAIDQFMSKNNVENLYGPEVVQNVPVFYPAPPPGIIGLPVEKDEIQFALYTTDNQRETRLLKTGDMDLLKKSGFNASAPIKIICHGFMSNFEDGPGILLRPAYFNATTGPLNIILINWSKLAGFYRKQALDGQLIAQQLPVIRQQVLRIFDVFYFPPAQNTRQVGLETARLIQFLVEDGGAPLSSFHLIGHSLGAQAMGYAGRFLSLPGEKKVPRITALDPASPCFETFGKWCPGHNPEYKAIRKTDADFVDVLHTGMELFGMTSPVGHLDIYVNGGKHQPGCGLRDLVTCDHMRSIDIMADTISGDLQKNPLPGYRCEFEPDFDHRNCTPAQLPEIGGPAKSGSEGIFIAYIEKTYPFSLNELIKGALKKFWQ